MTIIQQIEEAIEALKTERAKSDPNAAREFSIAITHLEDASMRVNRGFAFLSGRFRQADIQAGIEAEAAQVIAEAEATVHPDQLSLIEEESDLSSAA